MVRSRGITVSREACFWEVPTCVSLRADHKPSQPVLAVQGYSSISKPRLVNAVKCELQAPNIISTLRYQMVKDAVIPRWAAPEITTAAPIHHPLCAALCH